MAETSLSSINQLFTESWELTKKRFWPLVLLWLIQGLIVALILAGTIFALLGTSLGSMMNIETSELTATSTGSADTAVIDSLLTNFGVIFLAVMLAIFIIAIVLGPLFQAAMIALVASEEKISLGQALKVGWKKFLPVFLAGLLMMFFIVGGGVVLLIPGIFFAILFSFVFYEIVLYDLPLMDALKSSAGMVKQHFWAVVGRMSLVFLLAIGIGLISDSLSNANSLIFSIIDLVLNLGYSVFAVMYSVTLYKNLRIAAGGAKMSLMPITVISALGWLGIILLVSNVLQNL